MNDSNTTLFAPQLCIRSGVRNIEFYTEAFGAVERRRWTNDDGTIHVAELFINGAMFHLHEDSPGYGPFSPEKYNGTTTIIGLFVPNVDALMDKALAAGATMISPAEDYDYGYRQGKIQDPFGHTWMLEMKI